MARPRYVLLSSKGQIVIPVALRRQLGLKTGERLALHTSGGRGLLLEPVENGRRSLEADLERARTWVTRAGRDLVEELHRRRDRERAHREQ